MLRLVYVEKSCFWFLVYPPYLTNSTKQVFIYFFVKVTNSVPEKAQNWLGGAAVKGGGEGGRLTLSGGSLMALLKLN